MLTDCLFAVDNGQRGLLLALMKTLAFLFSLITVASGRLVHVPTNQVAVVGERVQFNCSTDLKYSINWHRIPFGSSSVEHLYLSKTVLDLRFNVTAINVDDKVTGYSLIIPSVQKEDAGIYRCIDDAGQGQQSNAQLTIIDSQPKCSSNIGPNGFICENDCGIQPEVIHCICSLGYTGDTAPDMHWMISNQGSLIPTSFQENHRTVSSNVSMKATLALAGASIVWYLAQRPHINWTSNKIKVLYVKQNSSSVVISHNKTFTCSAENNGICSYKWHARIGSGHQLEVSEGSTITIHRPGQYFCTATCTLNKNACTVTPLYVDFIFAESKDQSDGIMKIVIPVFVIVVLFVVSLILVVIALRRKKQLEAKRKDTLIQKRSEFEVVKVI